MRTLLLTLFVVLITTVCSEKCTETEFCKDKFQAAAGNIGHDKEEFCKLMLDLRYCVNAERHKCPPETIPEIESFMDNLFEKDPTCNGSNGLVNSTVISLIALLISTLW